MAKLLNDLKFISFFANTVKVLSIIRIVLTVGIIAFSVVKSIVFFKGFDNKLQLTAD